MMLSAFVYPGAGQFLQKRWIAGCIYAISFTLLFLLLAVEVVKPLFAFLNATLDWAAHAGMGNDTAPHRISLAWILTYFLAGMLVYFMNLADIVRANRKKAKPPPLPMT